MTARMRALLKDIFRPVDLFSLELVQLNVTDGMAKEVKNLNYRFNNDVSDESSHWGILPFALIDVSMATASQLCWQADQYTRTSNLTLTEVAMADTNPDLIPTEYHELVNLLRRYNVFLHHLVGDHLGHCLELQLRSSTATNIYSRRWTPGKSRHSCGRSSRTPIASSWQGSMYKGTYHSPSFKLPTTR